MKRLTIALLLLFPTLAFAQTNIPTLNQWTTSGGYLTPRTASSGIKVPSLANLACMGTDASGIFGAGVCSGGGSFPFTPTAYGVSTSTTLGLLNGFLSTASSTVIGTLNVNGWNVGTTTAVVCKNSTDCNYTTIGAAISAGWRDIYVKNGTYSEQITLANTKTKLRAQSLLAIIQCNGSTQSPCVTMSDESTIDGFTLNESNGSLNGVAINFSNHSLVSIINNRINNFATSTQGIDSGNLTFYTRIQNNTLFNPKTCLQFSGTQANANWISGNRCRPMGVDGGYGVFVQDSRGLSFSDNDVEGTTTSKANVGYYFDATSRDDIITAGWEEAMGTGISIASGANNITFIGQTITSNGTDITDAGTNSTFLGVNRTGTKLYKFPALTIASFGTPAGTIAAFDPSGNLISTSSSAGGVSAVTGAYPILSTGGNTPVISSGLSTTTNNTWSGANIFSAGLLMVGSTTINGNATTTGNHAVGSLTLNNQTFTSLNGTGLSISAGALTATLGTTVAPNELAGQSTLCDSCLITTSGGKTTFIATGTPYLTVGALIATTTNASRLPYASTTALSATTLCLTGDTCRTTWPAGGGNVSVAAGDDVISTLAIWSTTEGDPATLTHDNNLSFSGGASGILSAPYFQAENGVISSSFQTDSSSLYNSLLATDATGLFYATTTPTASNFIATSSRASQFPYASTTALSATTLCLTGDTCRTSWPTGGSSAWPWTIATTFGTTTNATTTGAWFQQGLYASSTSQLDFASTTALSATTICLTGDTCRTTWPSAGASIWPFTPSTNFGVAVQSTSTPLSLSAGLFASSTSQLVNANIWGNLTLKATSSALLATDSLGNIIATTSVGTNFLTGTLATINGTAITAGGSPTITAASSTLLANNNSWTGTNTFSGGFSSGFGSSTSQVATYTIDWSTGNTQKFLLTQNTTFVLNSTSSNPGRGGGRVLILCQDGVGSRTATFATPEALAWANGTTTISSAANTATDFGMIYDPIVAKYSIVASSTISDTRACK